MTADVGYFEIVDAKLTKFDGTSISIANMISQLTFNESIYSHTIYGLIEIVDASNLVDRFPLKGEETLTLVYKDFFEEELTQTFQIYGLQNQTPPEQQNFTVYTLTICSPQKILSDRMHIKKSYTGTMKQTALKVFEEIDDDTYPIEIEDTVGEQQIIIPSLTPLEALNFLARRSFSVDNPGSHFLFYLNRRGFQFKTVEKHLEDTDQKKLTYEYTPGQQASDRPTAESMYNLHAITLMNRHSTLEEIKVGAMVSEVVEIDILTKQYQRFPFQYKEQADKFTHMDKKWQFPHTDGYTEKFFNEPVVSDMVFIDSSRPGNNYKEILSKRRSQSYWLTHIRLKVSAFGTVFLQAGQILQINLPQFEETDGEKELNESLAGNWMVESITHKMKDKSYDVEMILVKDLPRAT